MSRYINVDNTPVFMIEIEPDARCEYCGKMAELRPYGKNGANICFECGMKDEEETERQFEKRLKPQ